MMQNLTVLTLQVTSALLLHLHSTTHISKGAARQITLDSMRSES